MDRHKTQQVWLTRPREDSIALARNLAAEGIASIIAPVMHIIPMPLPSLPMRPDAILLTSRHGAHAISSLPQAWRSFPTYCVGRATAHAAMEHGATRMIAGGNNLRALLPRLIADIPAGSHLLYLSGREVSADVPHLLAKYSIHVDRQVVYQAVAVHQLPESIRTALAANRIHQVVFFSPRTAQITAQLLHDHGLSSAIANITAVCLSANIANAASAAPWASLAVAPSPTRQAMQALLVSLAPKE